MQSGLSHLTTVVLLALADGPRHGYGVLQAVEKQSADGRPPRAASLYAALHRLSRDGFIEEADPDDVSSGGPRRIYYQITDEGVLALQAETDRLQRLLVLARQKDALAVMPWTEPRTES